MNERVVLVTGASRGIGKAIAEKFAQHGDRVFGTARQSESIKWGSRDRSKIGYVLILRYPFVVFHIAESNRIVIHAILDLRQDPEKIRERFSE